MHSSATLLKEAKNFHLKKRLGQHFLVNCEALETICAALGATASDTIVEVGPGIGFLTRCLVKTGAPVVAVDLDRESIAVLEEMNLPNVTVRHGDFLRFNLETLQFFKKEQGTDDKASYQHLKIVGNVPYQITGLILGHILGEIDKPAPWLTKVDTIVLTVQREVARRMVAQAGSDDYSKVSLLVSQFCQSEIVRDLPADDFFPPPKVKSAIVKMQVRERPLVKPNDVRLMKKIIDAGFRQRRKMLRNSLSFLQLTPSEIDDIFRRLSLDPQTRAERLSLQQFAMLSDAIGQQLKSNA